MTNQKYIVLRNKVTLDITPEIKYEYKGEEVDQIKYDNVESWEVITDERVKEIEESSDGSCIDPYHEYLRLYLTDGNTATFRNSYTDLFTF